jgi:hypothetical protein
MSLGETIDAVIGKHAMIMEAVVNHDAERCDTCQSFAAIRKAYEEMVQSLNVLSGPTGIEPSIEATRTFNRVHSANYSQVLNSLVSPSLSPAEDETYESVLARDPAKDKNGIELGEGDYVKIVVPVTAVRDGEIDVFVAGATIHVQSKNCEAVIYNPEQFPAGHGKPTDHLGPCVR